MRFMVGVVSVVLLVSGAAALLGAQSLDLAGRVVSQSGEPVSDVRITVAGTRLEVVSDASGLFRIARIQPSADGQVTIRAAMIGYKTVSMSVRPGDTDVRIVMLPAALELDEVVVTGTAGGSQARSLGNPIARVDVSAVVELEPPKDMQDLLRSTVAGVSIVSAPGGVGNGTAVRIRGGASLSLGSTPIVYVDGVRIDNDQNASLSDMRGGAVSRMNDLNSDEIENIEVILSPVDFRNRSVPSNMPGMPPWTAELYSDIQKELLKLKRQADGAAVDAEPAGSETNAPSS